MQAEPDKRNVAQRNDYWQKKTLEAVTSHPLNSAMAILTKLYWSIHNIEIPRNEDYRCRLDEPILQPLAWNPIRYTLYFTGVLGIWRCKRENKGELVHICLCLVGCPFASGHFFCSTDTVATLPFCHAQRSWYGSLATVRAVGNRCRGIDCL